MRILLIKNVLHNGDRYFAGQEIELSDAVAEKFIAGKLALACQIPASQPAGNDQSDVDEQESQEQGSEDEQSDVDEQESEEQGSEDDQPAKKSGGKKGK